jgi:hypothetical protein
MKYTIILFSALCSFACMGASTLDRQPLTTSSFAKSLLTNETAIQARAALGIGDTNNPVDGSIYTNLNASELRIGTVPPGRFPAALPAIDAALAVNINGLNVTGRLAQLDAKQLTNVFSAMLDVKTFGAVGDGVADDTVAITNALFRASLNTNTWIHIPAGTYKMTASGLIWPNTRLTLDPKAKLFRSAAIDNILRNYSDGTVGLYDCSSNIVVEGGIWDGNKANFPGDSTLLAFGHCRNITVRDAVFMNEPGGWHFIEFNSTKQGQIINCSFTNESTSEAVQLDIAADVSAFPWFGPYDNTPCDSILVQHCYWENVSQGIGSHRFAVGFPNRNVVIRNCTFTNFNIAIRAYNWNQVTVDGNFAINGHRFYDTDIEEFNEDVDPGVRRSDIKIINNYVQDMIRDGTQDRGVKIKWANNVQVIGNTFTNISRHAVGIDWPCQNFQVIGNQIFSCGQLASTGRGIYVFGAAEGIVSGNLITNCFDGAIQIGAGGIPVSSNIIVTANIAPKDGCLISSADRIGVFNNRFVYDITNTASSNVYTNGNFF